MRGTSLMKKEALVFLRSHSLGTIATINTRGTPEVAVVYFLVEEDFTLYFVTKVQTRKFNNVVKCSTATALVFDEKTLTSVEVSGRVKEVTDTFEFAQVIESFESLLAKKKGYWLPPISQIKAGRFVACKLIPKIIHFRKFKSRSNHSQQPQLISFNF